MLFINQNNPFKKIEDFSAMLNVANMQQMIAMYVANMQHTVYLCSVIKKVTRAATLNRETKKIKVMYFFIEQKDELVRKLNEVLSENDFDVVDEVWDNTNNALYKKYDMPAVYFFEDGYSRGNATDEELIALADRVKADGWKDCYYNDENDESLFKYLDKEFISIFSESVEKEINKRLN